MPDKELAIPLKSPVERAGSAEVKREILRAAIEEGCLDDTRLLAGFVDIGGVSETLTSLIDAFPKHFRHTFAAKANSMVPALEIIRAHGLGCEVASPGELHQALAAGFDPAAIVYDEPAKTREILEFVLERGINFNIDNFQEFDRVDALVGSSSPTSKIGFRINPQVGTGTIGAMSTATATSKFGIALRDDGNRERLIKAYLNKPWLTTIHTHIGSQGCALELMVRGIRDVVSLATEINDAGGRIDTIDIGGGLPVNFDSEDVSPTFADYAEKLAADVPALFDSTFVVKTEFGRSIFAKRGFIAARVEYTKNSGGRRIAIAHAGAQTAARTAFMPDLWAIRLGVFDRHGVERTGDLVEQDVAGPCCFAGDMLARERKLPLIEPGDYIMLHDTGAYYFTNPFYYNSLPPCAVYGAHWIDRGQVEFETWREQQTTADLSRFFG